MFTEAGIENKDPLGVYLTHEDGQAVFVYTTALDEADLQFSATVHTGGEVTIPSALASAMGVNGTDITWERVEREDGHFDFLARTEVHIPLVDVSQSVTLKTKPLSHVSKDMDYDGMAWKHEHFQLYLNVDDAERLDWSEEMPIGIKIVRANDVLSVMFTPNTSDMHPKSVKPVKNTGESQRDRYRYVANDIVRTMKIGDTPLVWAAIDGQLVLIPLEN
jgi:bifunctional DNA-binding transcriptional regulator/antitoxin component of YhaV-PrlF toxin-antitoxin module